MKNAVLNYETEILKTKDGEVKVSDYFSKDVILDDILEKYPEIEKHIELVELQDNDTFDKLSYRLYKTTDFWDLLLLLNIRDPLFGLSYNFDVVRTSTDNYLQKFKNQYKKRDMQTHREKELIESIMSRTEVENEKNRVVKVIKPKQINYVVTILRKNGEI